VSKLEYFRVIYLVCKVGAQHKHFWWDTLGTLSKYVGQYSSQIGHTTAH
jgi:hypothetical protein